ncbi:hypothetical protein BDV25DRAFT_135212 [Aspergillus avenaceus]|uniref:Peptidase metallopeptidase domain-containing protein n=1 Tax=Aspergillus avenaceus TaxID=36643 RepID=A0A5N6U971_ASPAV|nr:hypothetical protein BDV25DRAFT_135212 [Aspergillus avenaceus]
MSFCSVLGPDLGQHIDESLSNQIKPDARKRLELAMYDIVKWPPGTELRVRFLPRDETEPRSIDGTEEHKHLVRRHAPEWTKDTSIKFKFLDEDATQQDLLNAEIKIQFQNATDGWSEIGTSSEGSGNEPTMMLGVNGVLKRLILHEFGHALGAVHEHSSPLANFTWIEEGILDSFKAANPTKSETELRRQIQENICAKYAADMISTTRFDKRSIMIYQILPNWTQEGVGIDWPDDLSEDDKNWIRKAYPPGEIAYGGRFSGPALLLSRSSDSPRNQHLMQNGQSHIGYFTMRKARREPPPVAMGLIRFHVPVPKIRVGALLNDITVRKIKANLQCSGNMDNFLWCLGSWFAPEREDENFEVGTVSFESGVDYAEQTVRIQHRFHEPPEVVVWLQDIALDTDMDVDSKDKRFGVDVDAIDVKEAEFKLCIKWTGDLAKIHKTKVSWIACATRAGIKTDNLRFKRFTSESDFTDRRFVSTGQRDTQGIYHGIKSFELESKHFLESRLVQLETVIRDQTDKGFRIVTRTPGAVSVDVAYLVLYK